jgi:tRNA A-37 threonylcarbamoyl transferase component Bud32
VVSLSLEGQTLGRYRVLEPLGRGGMARVYRAYHPQLDRYVAIKVLRPDLAEEETFLARFRREAQAVARLRHANIVQVYDFDVQDGVPYMVMELLEGDTLKARLHGYRARGERMPLGEMVRVLLDVLEGLAYAHSEGMIHRDIKPANIMLTERGRAVLSDFGIAQIVGGTQYTVSGALLGTLNYMAPEQGLEGHCDARSDLYSLGIVFYEMLTQSIPFDADTPLAILMKHLNDPLPSPHQIAPAVPEPFERIALKALAKQPEDRYQSAEEMAQALRGAAEEAGIELPACISSPPPFTTTGIPSESVAVFSGTARAEIPDAQFADAETDPTLGRRLAEEIGARRATEQAAGKRSFQFLAGLFKQGVFETRIRPGTAILGAAGSVIIYNLMAVWIAGLTSWWEIFERGWPIEMLLVGLGLCVILYATSSIWLLIPVGILLGNGVLFSYCSITGNWRHWSFLWSLELLLILCTVTLTIWLAKDKEFSRWLSRPLGCALGLAAIIWSIMVFVATMIIALLG